MSVSTMLKGLGTAINKNSPTILTVVGIGGSVTAVILAVKETPRCAKFLNDARYEKHEQSEMQEFAENADLSSVKTTELTKKEVFGCYLRAYWPAIAVETGSILCFIFANNINLRRNAALGAALRLSESFLKEYEEHFKERFGEKEQRQFEHEINKKTLSQPENVEKSGKSDVGEAVPMKQIGKGTMPMIDKWSKQRFISSPDDLKEALNELNAQLLEEGRASLNDFYSFADLELTESGEILGWHCEGRRDFVSITYDPVMLPDKSSITAISFSPKPSYDYAY